MHFRLTLKNYRCFQDTKPLTIEIHDGFTALVGTNNSGKSAILKLIMEIQELRNPLWNGTGLVRSLISPVPMNQTIERLLCDHNNRPTSIRMDFLDPHSLSEYDTQNPVVPNAIEFILTRGSNSFVWVETKLLENGKKLDPNIVDNQFMEGNEPVIIDNDERNSNAGSKDRIQLSHVLSSLQRLKESLYIGPYRSMRAQLPERNYYDLFVDTSFVSQWNTWKNSTTSKEQAERADQVQEDIRHIFGFRRFEINASPAKDSLIVKINGRNYEVSEVGTGLAQFIAILGNAAFKKPSMIFLDEPELNLHASLQLDFLTTLAKYANGNIIFATHNLGLARQSSAYIYAIRQDGSGCSILERYEGSCHLGEYLGALSFAHTPGIGFEKVLLVEGRTEVLTIQQWLKLLDADHRVLLIPLGGQQYFGTHDTADYELAEFKRIGCDVWALIDSERNSAEADIDGNRKLFVERCKAQRIECHVLERRATENYLTEQAIQKVKGEKYCSLGHFESVKNAKNSWKKTENWRIAAHMTEQDLDNDLGDFLRRLVTSPTSQGGREDISVIPSASSVAST